MDYTTQLVFSESSTIVALLIPGVNTPSYNHRLKNLIYTKALDDPLTYIVFQFIAVAFLPSVTDSPLYKRLKVDLKGF